LRLTLSKGHNGVGVIHHSLEDRNRSGYRNVFFWFLEYRMMDSVQTPSNFEYMNSVVNSFNVPRQWTKVVMNRLYFLSVYWLCSVVPPVYHLAFHLQRNSSLRFYHHPLFSGWFNIFPCKLEFLHLMNKYLAPLRFLCVGYSLRVSLFLIIFSVVRNPGMRTAVSLENAVSFHVLYTSSDRIWAHPAFYRMGTRG
jgi:hypothetical protein